MRLMQQVYGVSAGVSCKAQAYVRCRSIHSSTSVAPAYLGDLTEQREERREENMSFEVVLSHW
jgi:hypothetical protein